MRLRSMILGVLLALTMAAPVFADPITFTFTSGSMSASALFEVVAGNLQVTLTNTGSLIGPNPSDAFNGVGTLFFNVVGDPTLAPAGIALGGSSTILQNSGGKLLGNGWKYDTLTSAEYGATNVISAVGLGLPYSNGGKSNFGPTATNLNGSDWVIVPMGYTAGAGNGNFGNLSNPVVRDSVIFGLSGIPVNFNPSTGISTVTIHYGTLLSDAHGIDPGPTVPEPASLLLVGSCLLGLGFVNRFRPKK